MLSGMRVFHKLLLIFSLDMIAVVFLGYSLAEEKYIAIDFAEKELVGNAYIDSIRTALSSVLRRDNRHDVGEAAPGGTLEPAAQTGNATTAAAQLAQAQAGLRRAQDTLGTGLDSAILARDAVDALQPLIGTAPADPVAIREAISALRALLARVGDNSNLILDPDLDSYYTMSLVLLRFPELVEALVELNHLVRGSTPTDAAGDHRTIALLILQGRLSTVAAGLENDFKAGTSGNPDGSLQRALHDRYDRLLATMTQLNRDLLTLDLHQGPGNVGVAGADPIDHAHNPDPGLDPGVLDDRVVTLLNDSVESWRATSTALDRLLQQRIDGFYHRMFMHFAIAGGLLAIIFTLVLTVARRIATPIAHLAGVAEQVRRDNDFTARATWRSRDEIGRLCDAFNAMLERLQIETQREQEMAARARAAEAQHDLIEAIPLPLLVTRVSDGRVLHINQPASALLGLPPTNGDGPVPQNDWLSPTDRAGLLGEVQNKGFLDGFEAACAGPNGSTLWALISARLLTYRNETAILTTLTPINERRRIEGELRAAKNNAELALTELREAQRNLIQSEKLASLGSLVAGVAHEINTPVGIGLTGASALSVETTRIRRLYLAEEMGQADFEDFLGFAEQTTQLLLSNMERAAALIQSFKQVAVDQVSDERRTFELRGYIDEVLTSLHPAMRKSHLQIHVDGADRLEMDSYPGALSQILTNLVLNAILHAFDDGDSGEVTIALSEPTRTEVSIRFSDNGKGIPESYLHRIFDPFFTTRRGSGGSGLGLHIVYNIVTGALQGRIDVESTVGSGTTFILTLPRVVAGNSVPDVNTSGALLMVPQ